MVCANNPRVIFIFLAANRELTETCRYVYLCLPLALVCNRNFHVWTECWMRRPDLGPEFDGWQVVDPTPQEKSAGWSRMFQTNRSLDSNHLTVALVDLGVFCCGPCPVRAIRQRHLKARFDAPFVYASVDADIVQKIVSDGRVVGKTVDTHSVGSFICTKSMHSDVAENLTLAYKCPQSERDDRFHWCRVDQLLLLHCCLCSFLEWRRRAGQPRALQTSNVMRDNGAPQHGTAFHNGRLSRKQQTWVFLFTQMC